MTEHNHAATIERLLVNPQVAWSLGRPGALAEFSWDDGEPVLRDACSMMTSRGALRITPEGGNVRLFAGETLGHEQSGWSHWLSVCLPRSESTMRGHATIAELGLDRRALNPEARRETLFDLGLGGPCFQLCVRTDAHALITALRAGIGEPLLSTDAVVSALMASSPTRVFESRLARIEVAQSIAPEHGRSPEGPHTHLLPELLHGDGTDSQNAPAGWVAQIVAYPPHPLRDAHGRGKPFDIEAHQAFQSWLDAFGDPEHVAVKRAVIEAVRSGTPPQRFTADAGRCDSIRVALQQLGYLEGDSPTLSRWREAYGDR